jgi:threonine dehydrogenase-like Zn-dependent dehydrogenase
VRGLVVAGQELAFRSDLPSPARPGETRVRVLLAGVCATDLALARGYMGFTGTPGHEFVGEALDGPLRGRRVVGEINAGCGRCARCGAGGERHCAERTVLGILSRSGAFAEELSLPAGNLHAVPDSLPLERAAFVEPLAAAFRVAEQLDLRAGERALVVGDGKLGLLVAQVLALFGLEVEVVGRHPERAERFPGVFTHRGTLAHLRASGARTPLVVEATGDPRVLPEVFPLVEPCGTLVLKTTSELAPPLDLAPLVIDEIRLMGSRCGPFAPALDALTRGVIDVAPLVHARYPLEEAARAFEEAGRSGTLKVFLELDR